MAWELIYTSAPSGIKSNTSGYCTVAATAGISPQIINKLESLSGYDFFFNLSDANAKLNPANFLHTKISIGSVMSSVISRIAFSGADHTGRINKIAHHFFLLANELSPGGPAYMLDMLSSGVFMALYDKPPQNLPLRSLDSMEWFEASGPVPSGGKWKALLGDQGWAGALARAYMDNKKTPAYLIYKPGMDILPLFFESLSVLPPYERWNVCFATYYNQASLPIGCPCNWRAVLVGTQAAMESKRYPGALVLDLTRPLGQVPENQFTDAARRGESITVDVPQEAIAVADPEPSVARKMSQATIGISPIHRENAHDVRRRETAKAPRAVRSTEEYAFPREKTFAGKLVVVMGIMSFILILFSGLSFWLWHNERNKAVYFEEMWQKENNDFKGYKNVYGVETARHECMLKEYELYKANHRIDTSTYESLKKDFDEYKASYKIDSGKLEDLQKELDKMKKGDSSVGKALNSIKNQDKTANTTDSNANVTDVPESAPSKTNPGVPVCEKPLDWNDGMFDSVVNVDPVSFNGNTRVYQLKDSEKYCFLLPTGGGNVDTGLTKSIKRQYSYLTYRWDESKANTEVIGIKISRNDQIVDKPLEMIVEFQSNDTIKVELPADGTPDNCYVNNTPVVIGGINGGKVTKVYVCNLHKAEVVDVPVEMSGAVADKAKLAEAVNKSLDGYKHDDKAKPFKEIKAIVGKNKIEVTLGINWKNSRWSLSGESIIIPELNKETNGGTKIQERMRNIEKENSEIDKVNNEFSSFCDKYNQDVEDYNKAHSKEPRKSIKEQDLFDWGKALNQPNGTTDQVTNDMAKEALKYKVDIKSLYDVWYKANGRRRAMIKDISGVKDLVDDINKSNAEIIVKDAHGVIIVNIKFKVDMPVLNNDKLKKLLDTKE